MEIILSNQCESLTGSLGRGFGYFIVGRWSRKDVKYRYYSQRSRWDVPPDGHLRFILTCAILALSKLHIADIRISAKEFRQACNEADRWYGDEVVKALATHVFNAYDVIRFKQRWNL
jgi:hypothetical protein